MIGSARQDIFTNEAIDVIYNYSGGLPRKINNVCDMCLLIGFGREVRVVDKDLAESVVADLNTETSIYAKDV